MTTTIINFRDTAAFVTDGAGQTYTTSEGAGGSDAYPTTRAGITFGWTGNNPSFLDLDSGVNPRFAGMAYVSNALSPRPFQIDLPSTGQYDITAAFGEVTGGQTIYAKIYDNTTVIATITNVSTGGAAHFVDASGVARTSIADWLSNNVAVTHTFTSTTLVVEIGAPGGVGSGSSVVATVGFVASAAAVIPGRGRSVL